MNMRVCHTPRIGEKHVESLASLDDIALAALYLASPAAKWVTGKILEVDGGMEATNMPV